MTFLETTAPTLPAACIDTNVCRSLGPNWREWSGVVFSDEFSNWRVLESGYKQPLDYTLLTVAYGLHNSFLCMSGKQAVLSTQRLCAMESGAGVWVGTCMTGSKEDTALRAIAEVRSVVYSIQKHQGITSSAEFEDLLRRAVDAKSVVPVDLEAWAANLVNDVSGLSD